MFVIFRKKIFFLLILVCCCLSISWVGYGQENQQEEGSKKPKMSMGELGNFLENDYDENNLDGSKMTREEKRELLEMNDGAEVDDHLSKYFNDTAEENSAEQELYRKTEAKAEAEAYQIHSKRINKLEQTRNSTPFKRVRAMRVNSLIQQIFQLRKKYGFSQTMMREFGNVNYRLIDLSGRGFFWHAGYRFNNQAACKSVRELAPYHKEIMEKKEAFGSNNSVKREIYNQYMEQDYMLKEGLGFGVDDFILSGEYEYFCSERNYPPESFDYIKTPLK